MSGETIITIAGNLVAPAELRFTPSGAAVASFQGGCATCGRAPHDRAAVLRWLS